MRGKAPFEVEDRVLINPSDLNSGWSMHGGRLFYLLDLKAAIVARNHSGYTCYTVAGSSFKYFAPINTEHELIIRAKITKAWGTSMEIQVKAYRKSLSGLEEKVFGIYLYFVAVKDGELQQVSQVIPKTKEEKTEYNLADKRREEVKDFIEKYIETMFRRQKTGP